MGQVKFPVNTRMKSVQHMFEVFYAYLRERSEHGAKNDEFQGST